MMGDYDHQKDPEARGMDYVVRDLSDDGGPCIYRHYHRPNGNVGSYKKMCGPFASVEAAKDAAQQMNNRALWRPLTDEQKRIYNKLRPVVGREAALEEASKGDGET